MPLTKDQLDAYQANLSKQADDEAQSQLGNTWNGGLRYGSGSMTNTVNKYNYARQQDHLNALAKREELAQSWENAQNQKAMTEANIKHMAGEGVRGRSGLALQWQQQKQQQEDANRTYGLNTRMQDWREKNDAIHANIAAHQAAHNMALQNKQLGHTEWLNRADLALRGLGLQLNSNLLMQKLQSGEALPTSDTDMLNWLSGVVTPIGNSQQQQQAGRMGAMLSGNQAGANLQNDALTTALQLHRLGHDQRNNVLGMFRGMLEPLQAAALAGRGGK
jgi:hypothetical protein